MKQEQRREQRPVVAVDIDLVCTGGCQKLAEKGTAMEGLKLFWSQGRVAQRPTHSLPSQLTAERHRKMMEGDRKKMKSKKTRTSRPANIVGARVNAELLRRVMVSARLLLRVRRL